jgi:hypothetical protein
MTQIRQFRINSTQLKIYIIQNDFLAGIIDTEKREFYHVPRSAKNLFHLFGKPGLGINQEILLRNDFKIIKIKYLNEILSCHRLKWLNKGITSPYCNQKVDKQIILALNEINLDYVEPAKAQGNIFQEV